MFDIDIQLSPDDLYAMSPKYAVCAKCNATHKLGATCVPCALRWATVAQLIQQTTKAYNDAWRNSVVS